MKIGVWLALLLVVLDISIFITPAECFTIPVSVSTGMAIIIALVKVKAIIVKVLLGLKAMGYDSFVWRTSRRRREINDGNSAAFTEVVQKSGLLQNDELFTAWKDLQDTVGKVIQFDLMSCTEAAENAETLDGRLRTLILPWEIISKDEKDKSQKEYSTWVSKILGSTIKDPLACQILEDELQKSIEKDTTQIANSTTKES